MTLQEFLIWEEQQELRYEFDGFASEAMTGGTNGHDLISVNVVAALHSCLQGKPCRAHGSNLKIKVGDSIRYPDAFVTCAPIRGTSTVIMQPVIIFEVLSPSSATKDRLIKSQEYRSAASVTQYVMLDEDHVFANILEREGERWFDTLAGPGDVLRFPAIGVEISLDSLYENVEFREPTEENLNGSGSI